MSDWFSVDRAGLAAILERRGKFFALAELIANAWDSGSDRVSVSFSTMTGEPYALLSVQDWGEGFADPKDAFTMFGKSRRGSDLSKRGRFDLGEKLALAVCRRAEIITTGWGLAFDPESKPIRISKRVDVGTLFECEIRMTRDEYREVCDQMKRLIPPVATSFNGNDLLRHEPITTFKAKLPTEIADAEGLLRRSTATASVDVYECFGECPGEILELGIPVVETDNGYRVNVLQKVPLNMERDNVTPGFLRTINVLLLNQLHDKLTPETAASPWAQEAMGDSRATPQAVKDAVTARFGERAIVATPGDVIANARAEAAGFTVIPGGSLSAGAWSNIRKHELLTSTSRAFPTPKPEDIAKAAEGKCPVCGK